MLGLLSSETTIYTFQQLAIRLWLGNASMWVMCIPVLSPMIDCVFYEHSLCPTSLICIWHKLPVSLFIIALVLRIIVIIIFEANFYRFACVQKDSIRPFQVVVLFLVRVFPQHTGGRAGFIIMPLLRYHPRNVTMLTAAAPSYSIILDHW